MSNKHDETHVWNSSPKMKIHVVSKPMCCCCFLQRNTSWKISYGIRILYITQIVLFYFILHKEMT